MLQNDTGTPPQILTHKGYYPKLSQRLCHSGFFFIHLCGGISERKNSSYCGGVSR